MKKVYTEKIGILPLWRLLCLYVNERKYCIYLEEIGHDETVENYETRFEKMKCK